MFAHPLITVVYKVVSKIDVKSMRIWKTMLCMWTAMT